MSRDYKLLIRVVCIAGAATGLGLYLAYYARAASYLTDDPTACANCHVMNEQFAGWTRSSHKAVAACNDCHAPPEFFPKYGTKALNGLLHSYAFTTGDFNEPIIINDRNRDVTERTCRHCHAPLTHSIDAGRENENCIRCHAQVGHE